MLNDRKSTSCAPEDSPSLLGRDDLIRTETPQSGILAGIAQTRSFVERQRTLSGYVYALIRVIEHSSAWVGSTQDIDFKIALGQLIGHCGEEVANLHYRLKTLLTKDVTPIATDEYECWLASAATLHDVRSQAAFLSGTLSGLCRHLAWYMSNTDPIGDQPTVMLLRGTEISLNHQIAIISSFAADWQDIAFPAPVTATNSHSYLGTEAVPPLVDQPGRPETWQYSEQQIIKPMSHQNYDHLIELGEHMQRWLHQVGIDVEINAMEICGRNIVEFRDMPIEFKLDMARQVWDETRHAQMMRRHLKELGSDFGDYTYCNKVWSKYMLGSTLAERLAIEQVLQEGHALEANIPFGEAMNDAGILHIAEMIDYVDADELRHAYFGCKWLIHIHDGSDTAYLDTVRDMAIRLDMPLAPRGPLQAELRKVAGYPDAFIDLLTMASSKPPQATSSDANGTALAQS